MLYGVLGLKLNPLVANINGEKKTGESLTVILGEMPLETITSIEVTEGSVEESEITKYFGNSPQIPNLVTFIHSQTGITNFPGGCFNEYLLLEKASIWVTENMGDSFKSCPKLGDVYLKGNPRFGMFSRPFYNSAIKNFTAPDYIQTAPIFSGYPPLETAIFSSMKSVPYSFFAGLKNLTHVELSSEKITIGSSAFQGCGLKEFPAFNYEVIESSAFANCMFTTVELKSDVTLGSGAFSGCLLQTFSAELLTTLSAQMFYGCTYLTSISVPKATSIPSHFAHGCSNLTKIVVGTSISVGDSAFRDCVSLPWSEMHSFTSIGTKAFSGCSFENIIIQGNPSISDSAFHNNSLLKEFKALDLEVIGSLFPICPILEIINIPKVTSIPNSFAAGAAYLTTVTMTKDAIGSIGWNAFNSCTKLQWTNWNIREIGESAFYNCSFTEITILGTSTIGTNAFALCPIVTFVAKTITAIGDIFKDCNSLQRVEIPSATLIETGAMKDRTSLETVIMSTDPIKLGSDAFSGCTSLNWGNWTFSQISWNAFQNCVFPNVFLKGNPNLYADIFKGNKMVTFSAPDITKIGSIFSGCNLLESITLPSCNEVEYNAFSNLPKLKTVILSQSLPVAVGDSAFSNCQSLLFPNCSFSSIGGNAFEKCGFSLVIINGSLTIKPGAFADCPNLLYFEETGLTVVDFASIATRCPIQQICLNHAGSVSNIPKSVNTFTSKAIIEITEKTLFKDLDSLQTLKMESLKKLDFGFSGCTCLQKVILDSVTEISDDASFSGTKLDSVSFKALVSIPSTILLFQGCPLKTISLPENPPKTFNSGTFLECQDCHLVIPKGSNDLYDNDLSVEGDVQGDQKWCGLKIQEEVTPTPTLDPTPVPTPTPDPTPDPTPKPVPPTEEPADSTSGSQKTTIIAVSSVLGIFVVGGVIAFVVWRARKVSLLESYEGNEGIV